MGVIGERGGGGCCKDRQYNNMVHILMQADLQATNNQRFKVTNQGLGSFDWHFLDTCRALS